AVSAASFLHQHNMPGYLVSLDFYHAYDRVCMAWVDQVLEAMGFGRVLRGWVATLHRGASAVFMLHGLSREIEVIFSMRQGDPLAQILFVIQEEPFLLRLEASLHGLRYAGLREASLAYVDDVSVLSSKIEDLVVLDGIVSDYEAASGAILNRNTKTVIMGLGSWAGRQDWPLPWIHTAPHVKLFGVHIAPAFEDTVRLSWDYTVGGLEATLRMWSARALPYLTQRSQVLHTFAMSKLWYMAQILPLPKDFVNRIRRSASDFLWRGRLERLAWAELAAPKQGGGLAVACVETRARALYAKQACHRLASNGRPARHLSYWLGLKLLRFLPGLRAGLHAENAPQHYNQLAELLLEVLGLDSVRPENLGAVTSRGLYAALRPEGPVPKIKLRLPGFPWTRIWGRLALPSLPQQLFEIGFNFLNNILPTGERRHRMRLVASPACTFCQAPVESVAHVLTGCTRVAEAWEYLLFTVSRLLGGPVSDLDLLFLKFPICSVEIHIIYAVLAFADLAWVTRTRQEAVSPQEVKARLSQPPKPFKCIFKI
ncbi:MAG: hypothetical protein FJ333_10665, partial [Sphingomonadales bacterium]|nr:hypothetical protein [Sphingomonadales bacterium]